MSWAEKQSVLSRTLAGATTFLMFSLEAVESLLAETQFNPGTVPWNQKPEETETAAERAVFLLLERHIL